ncbi:electron transfer flavoprotein subunit alpha/FixB family protein [Magnetofaba australis]|uniref:Putative electron transfer flavoprotein subunit alpha n=1 Tax=Magnetofaba australis IT-1 TaxID=1434232 RepID=A0A1Y2K9N1_9PROT|nr:FAD-binding protein [Magnetofaba australis]OSM07186.1 putative electron transfer flavoprotein subunit alpha [Magnetofaba australis IT-1]
MTPPLRTLLVAECRDGAIVPATWRALSMAHAIGASVDLLVLEPQSLADDIRGVARILTPSEAPPATALAQAAYIAHAMDAAEPAYSHLILPATAWGREILPRVAARLGAQPLSEICAVTDAHTFSRPIHAGNAIQTLTTDRWPILLSARPAAFAPFTPPDDAPPPSVATLAPPTEPADDPVRVVDFQPARGERPDLREAAVVACGGQGMASAGDFTLIEQLADALGGAVGATRAAVDSGLAPNDWQVGQTGKIVAPDLYIGVGVSGAIQHIAGIKDARCIVSINNDPGAPLHAVADYRLTMDLREAIPQWLALLAARQ